MIFYILITLLIIFLIFINKKEYFLVPSHSNFCENIGLEKSYMPQQCMILNDDGTIKYWNRNQNCKCIDPNNGFCRLCYPKPSGIKIGLYRK